MKTKRYKHRNKKRKLKKTRKYLKGGVQANSNDSFKNVILVVVFNYSDCVINKSIFKQIYEPYFKKVIFYSDIPTNNDSEINYIDIAKGESVYKVFSHLYNNFKDLLDSSDGLFYTMDDNIINVNILNNFDSKKIIYSYPTNIITDLNTVHGWQWDPNTGKAAINNLILDESFKQYNLNEYIGGFSDFFYLPKQYITEKLINLFDLFGKYSVHMELAIPTVIYYIEKNVDMYQNFYAVILWREDRKKLESIEGISDVFNKNPLFVHPIKLKGKEELVNYLINNIFKVSR